MEKKKSVDQTSDVAELDQTKPVADRISALPDEIIELILSKMKLKDAIRTEVLSCRWKHMWEYTTGMLDFDSHIYAKLRRVDEEQYINIVDKILNAHKGSTIEAFKVMRIMRYKLGNSNKLVIDSWIEFALRKKVRRLELSINQRRNGQYEFPVLEKSKSSYLTSLILHSVKVTDKVLNHLLLNCPFLESLSVERLSSDDDVHLVPCPQLKLLKIGTRSEVLEISSALNLTSFIFSGSDTSLSIKNVPNLTHVSLRGAYFQGTVEGLHDLPSFLFQIKKLTLDLETIELTFPKFPKFPELKNVNELKLASLRYDPYQFDILSCASLMEACPNMYRFSVELTWAREEQCVQKGEKWSVTNKCLKVVELEGFNGTIL